MRPRSWLTALTIFEVMVAALAAQVYPVRWEDEPVETLAAGTAGTLSADTVQLRVQTEPPFTCTASTLGHLYIQQDLCNPATSANHELCFCGEAKGKGMPEIDWWFVRGVTRCSEVFICP